MNYNLCSKRIKTRHQRNRYYHVIIMGAESSEKSSVIWMENKKFTYTIAIRWRDTVPLGGLIVYLAMHQCGRLVEYVFNWLLIDVWQAAGLLKRVNNDHWDQWLTKFWWLSDNLGSHHMIEGHTGKSMNLSFVIGLIITYKIKFLMTPLGVLWAYHRKLHFIQI